MIAGGFSLIQAIDGFVFQPFIVGPQAALHPLAVILSLVVGAQFGLGGMILAVPFAAAIKVIWVEIFWKKTSDFLEKKK
jgi:predicted PurR-regulated permease PerM